MKKLVLILFAITLIVITGECRAQGGNTQQKQQDDTTCTNLGLYFHHFASLRDKGVSIKEQLDISAKVSQEVKVEGYSPIQITYMTVIIMTYVYTNPPYKATGPEMNKMMAEYRCNKIGAEAFLEELIQFSKAKSK